MTVNPIDEREAKFKYITERASSYSNTGDRKHVANLMVYLNNGEEECIKKPVYTGVNFIGSASQAVDIHLDAIGVSGIHALIDTDGTEHFIEDLSSTNGTVYGDGDYMLVEKRLYQLLNNKTLHFGPTRCIYQIINAKEQSSDEIINTGQLQTPIKKMNRVNQIIQTDVTTVVLDSEPPSSLSGGKMDLFESSNKLSLGDEMIIMASDQMVVEEKNQEDEISKELALGEQDDDNNQVSFEDIESETSLDLGMTMDFGNVSELSEIKLDNEMNSIASIQLEIDQSDPIQEVSMVNANDSSVLNSRAIEEESELGNRAMEVDQIPKSKTVVQVQSQSNSPVDSKSPKLVRDVENVSNQNEILSSPQPGVGNVKKKKRTSVGIPVSDFSDAEEQKEPKKVKVAVKRGKSKSQQQIAQYDNSTDEDSGINARQKSVSSPTTKEPVISESSKAKNSTELVTPKNKRKKQKKSEQKESPAPIVDDVKNNSTKTPIESNDEICEDDERELEQMEKSSPVVQQTTSESIPSSIVEVEKDVSPKGSKKVTFEKNENEVDEVKVPKSKGKVSKKKKTPIKASLAEKVDDGLPSIFDIPEPEPGIVQQKITYGTKGKKKRSKLEIKRKPEAQDSSCSTSSTTNNEEVSKTNLQDKTITKKIEKNTESDDDLTKPLKIETKDTVEMNFTPDSRPVRQRKKTVMTDMIAPDDSTELVDLFTSMKSSNKVPESVHETPLPVRVKAVRQPKKRTRTRSSDLEIDNSSVVQIAKEPSPQKITINSANDKQYRILFTGINNVEKYAKMIEMLNGVQVEDWKECTHLVTNGIKRTVKFLCCVSTGKYIMDVKWLENSKKAGSFIDEEKFCLKDSANEKKFNFNLKSILEKSRLSSPIFNGLSFYSTKSAFPKLQDLQAIVEGAGGKLLSKAPSKLLESTYIVSSTADQQECEKLKRLGYQMYSIEMILTGILTQQLDLDKFILNLENDD